MSTPRPASAFPGYVMIVIAVILALVLAGLASAVIDVTTTLINGFFGSLTLESPEPR